jgi:hypothetical protein
MYYLDLILGYNKLSVKYSNPTDLVLKKGEIRLNCKEE